MPFSRTSASAVAVLLTAGTVRAIDNSLGLTPPMGWRSWNCFHGRVTQPLMEGIMDAMANRSRTVDGQAKSLLDLGYANCGLDDNWQQCGGGALGGFHDHDGNPIVNTNTFPNMSAMTEHGHKLGLRVGWYMNNCICGEHQYTDDTTPSVTQIMERSAASVAEYGFDGVKLDGCSEFRNLTWWAQLLNETGRPILIENCHWGGTIPGDTGGDGPCKGTTTPSDCPYNFFRSSGDISNNWDSMFRNLQSTVKFSNVNPPLSRPGTWTYPDMLEVGRMPSPQEDRTHFAAWSIISSPLVLGFDLTDDVTMDKVWDIIANPETIAVNQDWAGDPGTLVRSWNPEPPSNSTNNYTWAVNCDSSDSTQASFVYKSEDSSIRKQGNGPDMCLDTNSDHVGTIEMMPCNGSSSQKFTWHGNSTAAIEQNGKCLDVFDLKGPVVQMYHCNNGQNQHFTYNPDGKSSQIKAASGQCLASRVNAPTEGPTGGDVLQLWAKRLSGGAAAALVINGYDNDNHTATISLKDLGLDDSKEYTVRCIFERKDIGTAGSEGFTTDSITPHDSRFLKFTPKN